LFVEPARRFAMSEPFGKRNRRQIIKPERAKVHKHARPATPPSKSRFYILVGVALLVMAVGGYALAL
jgi:hypothetical protein